MGSYSSTKWLCISWIVRQDFPTPPPPTTTSLYSRRNFIHRRSACIPITDEQTETQADGHSLWKPSCPQQRFLGLAWNWQTIGLRDGWSRYLRLTDADTERTTGGVLFVRKGCVATDMSHESTAVRSWCWWWWSLIGCPLLVLSIRRSSTQHKRGRGCHGRAAKDHNYSEPDAEAFRVDVQTFASRRGFLRSRGRREVGIWLTEGLGSSKIISTVKILPGASVARASMQQQLLWSIRVGNGPGRDRKGVRGFWG